MKSEFHKDDSFYHVQSQPTSTEQLNEQFDLLLSNKTANRNHRNKRRDESVQLSFNNNKKGVSTNQRGLKHHCVLYLSCLTKYLSMWSELIEGKCPSITKSSNFLKRTLTYCYNGQNNFKREREKIIFEINKKIKSKTSIIYTNIYN